MAGIPIAEFLDWQINTGPIQLSGEFDIVNDVSARSFMLGKLLRGKPMSQVLQGGNKIQFTIFLSLASTFQEFERGEDVNWSNPQKDVQAELDFKFTLDHMTWDEWEYLGQTSSLVGGQLKTKYKDMAYSKQQRLWTSKTQGLEDIIWFPPNGSATFAAMESGGKKMYSIPAFVHENQGTGGKFDSNWTTLEGITQADHPTNWDNARSTYDATDPIDADGDDDGLFNAFDDIALKTNFRPPGIKDNYFEDEAEVGVQTLIACSRLGSNLIRSMNRKSNDSLIQPQDGSYPFPRWNGAAIFDVAALDGAKLYDAVTTGNFVAENVTTGGDTVKTGKPGARFYFLNTEYLHMIFHSAKYFQMLPVVTPTNKVGVHVIPVETWGNFGCSSRRHQGLVSPQ